MVQRHPQAPRGTPARSRARGLDRRGDLPAPRRPVRRPRRAGRLTRSRAPDRARGARRPRPRRFAEGVAAPPRALAHASARERRRAPPGPGEGLPLRGAPPAPRTGVRLRGHPLARARHRREHGDLSAARRRAPAQPADRQPRGAAERAHRSEGRGPHRQLHHELPPADLADLRSAARRAEGLLEAGRLGVQPRQPRHRRQGALRECALGRRDVLRHRRCPAAAGPAPRSVRRSARLPLAVDRRERALLAARARRTGALARPDPHGRGTPVRDRGHHARPILRSRSRLCVRRRAAHVRRKPPRGQAPDAEPLGLVALGRGPARPRLDAREGQRAPGRHLEGDFRGVAAGELRRRRREAVPPHDSHRGPGLDRLLGSARGLFRPAVAPARPLRPRAVDRVRQHRQPHDRPGERASARDRRAPRPRRLAASA